MKNLSFIALPFALLLGATSCNKEKDDGLDPALQEKEINIRLQSENQPNASPSKAIETPIAAGETVVVADGLVYFLSEQDNVLAISDMNTSTIFSATGQRFTKINGLATHVYVVGNYKAITPSIEANLRGATSLIKIKEITAQVASQQAVGATGILIANALDLIGNPTYDAKIKLNSANSTYESYVLLAPTMTRIQLADIKSTDTKIIDYTFEGIYVDNFYQLFSPATDKSGTAPLLTVGTDNTLLGTLATSMFDVAAPTVVAGSDKIVTAAEAKATTGNYMWAYQVATTGNTGSDIPRLIVKLSSVKVLDNSGNVIDIGPKYITITGYTDSSGNPINQLLAGNVYQIPAGAFDFSLDKLGDTPNAPKREVVVYAKVLGWTISNVGVEM